LNSDNSNDIERPLRSFTFVQLHSGWKDFTARWAGFLVQ